MDLCRLLFKYPGLAKVIYQNVILKGKDKDAMLDAAQLAAGEAE